MIFANYNYMYIDLSILEKSTYFGKLIYFLKCFCMEHGETSSELTGRS